MAHQVLKLLQQKPQQCGATETVDLVLVSNRIKYWSNYSIRNFEYSHSTKRDQRKYHTISSFVCRSIAKLTLYSDTVSSDWMYTKAAALTYAPFPDKVFNPFGFFCATGVYSSRTSIRSHWQQYRAQYWHFRFIDLLRNLEYIVELVMNFLRWQLLCGHSRLQCLAV